MLTLVLEPMLEQVLERALPWNLVLPLNVLQADSHSQVGTRTITGLALELAKKKKKKKKAASNSGVDASVRAGVNSSCGAGLNSVATAENGTGYSRGSGAEAGGSID